MTGHYWRNDLRNSPPNSYRLFSPAGEAKGVVVLPEEPRIEVLAIGGGRLLGVERGEFGVPIVGLYRLDHPMQ